MIWRLRLLGDLSLHRSGVEFRRLRAQKYAHLLAYLALNPTRAHGREELLEIFWPEEELSKARTCLRTALSSLRRQLDCPDLFLDGATDTIRINPNAIVTDVHEFEQAVARQDSGSHLLYTGPLLSGCYYDWALDERLRLEALFEQAQLFEARLQTTPDKIFPNVSGVGQRSPVQKLPTPISSFYGRVEEIEMIRKLFVEERSRLVSLVGIGGIGKTRLAIEAARTFSHCRVVFVGLAEQSHTNGLILQVADTLEVSRTPTDSLESRLFLELKSELTLLVLDNFEQLVDEEPCQWLQELLSESPSLSALVTSRLVLGIEGEQVCSVRPLSQSAAMALFMDRARHVLPDFPYSTDLPKLCDSLDRLPLAIVLCASWAHVLSASRMLAGLSQRFDLMQSRKRMIAERHQSLYAVIEWSCPADSRLQTSLGMLSVLRGNWTLEAAEAILGSGAALTVSFLTERSLIQSDVVGGTVRFHQLESVRDFGASVLSSEDLFEVRRRHHRFFADLACFEAKRHAQDAYTAFDSLAREHPNIFDAFDFGVTGPQDLLESTLRALYRVKWCWWVRGYGSDWNALLAKAATRITEPISGSLRGLVLAAAASVAANDGDLEKAIQFSLEAKDCLDTENDLQLRIENYRANSHYREELGDFEGALEELEQLIRLIPDDDRQSYYINLAHVASILMEKTRDIDRAEGLYRSMLEFWQTQPNSTGHRAVITRSLGRCAMFREDYDQAELMMKQAIGDFQLLGELIRESQTWQALSDCYRLRGDLAAAQQALENAHRLSEDPFP